MASAKKCKHCGDFLERKQAMDVGYLPPDIESKLPAMVRSEVKKLSQDKMNYFLDEYQRRSKITSTAYICWLFFGVHYGYIGRWGMQVIFWLTVGGFMVWWFLDLFRVPGLVRDSNKDIAISVLRDLKIVGGS